MFVELIHNNHPAAAEKEVQARHNRRGHRFPIDNFVKDSFKRWSRSSEKKKSLSNWMQK
uniref:Uncharacterized protein n=1 Tax=Picea sitchensis TaxID=3332 RepID=A9NY50_PICSI|nr:unknown [Picea sitchensis]